MNASRVRTLSRCITIALILLGAVPLLAGGNVYLILGSDTALWDGMDVSRHDPHYTLSLYLDPTLNAYKVMEPSFRSQLVDSYGTPMKLTWWMMAGNIFRYADNTNVPVANTMTLYLMKKYHGARVAQFGDELSLHYHTFAWTDYDRDGKFYWNQSHGFEECRDDFDVTMAQFLLEEDCYPVSFRSGWHYMDNAWQQYLNTLLPYSMDNDYPAKRFVTNEPIDNNFDWSLASKAWVPFRPSPDNYQLPGGTGGWNLRSKHIGSVTSAIMNDMFLEASKGADQAACLWGHLPEADFLDNLRRIDSLAHGAEKKYAGVTFRYCTAVEAMQRWRTSADVLPPALSITAERKGETISFLIASNEPIFQQQPFVAMKDVYERASVLRCTRIGVNTWRAVTDLPASGIAKVSAAVTDTMGNLATAKLLLLADDAFIDNRDSGYAELRGAWTTTAAAAWGADARQAVLVANDSAVCSWSHTVTHTGMYNFFVQQPAAANGALNSIYRIIADGTVLGERTFPNAIDANKWVLVGTQSLTAGSSVTVRRIVNGTGQAGRIAASDVLKISGLVRERSVSAKQSTIVMGDISELDTARVNVALLNNGIASLTVSAVSASSPLLNFAVRMPIVIPAMSSATIPLKLYPTAKGALTDTIRVSSNDPLQPLLSIPFTANVIAYFVVADNDDPLSYTEAGSWSNSVAADCYGTTSRFAPISSTTAHARFTITLPKSGVYAIQGTLPKTVNASTRARYVLKVNGTAVDSMFADQNTGSGNWVTYFTRQLPARVPIEIDIGDASVDKTANLVLRADAMRFKLDLGTGAQTADDAAIPSAFALEQNYPNPFNPSTTIRYSLPVRSFVRLEVFNTLGQRVATVREGMHEAGHFEAVWKAAAPSGLYFLRFHAETGGMDAQAFTETRKMMLVR